MGLTLAPLSATVINAVPSALEGQASDAYNSTRELGGVFGVATLGAVFQHIATLPTGASFISGFRIAVFAGVVIVAIGTILLPTRAISSLPAVDSRADSATRVLTPESSMS